MLHLLIARPSPCCAFPLLSVPSVKPRDLFPMARLQIAKHQPETSKNKLKGMCPASMSRAPGYLMKGLCRCTQRKIKPNPPNAQRRVLPGPSVSINEPSSELDCLTTCLQLTESEKKEN